MSLAFHHPQDVLEFACAKLAGNVDVALIIASKVTGGAMRASGAMMCAASDGSVAGYISNGCVDADIIFQAQEAIAEQKPRALRYGDGSPFRDIILPCGGQIDLWVRPDLKPESIQMASNALKNRSEAELEIGPDGQTRFYTPKLRIRVAGRGDAAAALSKQAVGAGFEVILQSPDKNISQGKALVRFDHLVDPEKINMNDDDPWTAVVVMFHDHDWEPYILRQALSGEAFYIGAMGSSRTHEIRKLKLAELGLTAETIDRVTGPIGLIPSMRDANLLALSTLAEIVDRAQRAGRLQ